MTRRTQAGFPMRFDTPSLSSLIGALRRAVRPPRSSVLLNWARVHASASVLASLARAYLASTEARAVERLLRGGHHEKAAVRFCERFSARCFPLEYVQAGARGDRLLLQITEGIQYERYGENWEDVGDLWSLKPVFLLSWALMEDPYGALRDEFMQDEPGAEEERDPYRLCDEARSAIAQFTVLKVDKLFAEVPVDGFSADHLQPRFAATIWEPLLWAAPWLWRLTGNPFLDESDDDFGESEAWSLTNVLRLTAEYREALRIMLAIHRFDEWLSQDPAERACGAVRAALGPPADRMSNLTELPVLARQHQGSVLEQDRLTERV